MNLIHRRMENKYYSPTIEEFHVGFEYEQDYDHVMHVSERYEEVDGEYITKSTWFPKVFTDKDWEFIDHLVRTEFVRVKHLDQEDIESLGWKHVGGQLLKGGLQTYGFKDTPYLLYYSEWNPTFLSIDSGYGGIQVFRGIIKNKSELKILMQWLNITKE